VDVVSEVVIDRPLDEVFDFMSKLENVPQWLDGCKKVWVLEGDPEAVGGKVAHLDEFMGREFEAHFEVVEWEPKKRMVFEAVSGPFRGTSEEMLQDEGDGTLVTIRVKGDPAGFLKLLGFGAKRMAQQQIDRSLENLREILEQDA
jgi:carbon monoxide dehydrogenase subunit G